MIHFVKKTPKPEWLNEFGPYRRFKTFKQYKVLVKRLDLGQDIGGLQLAVDELTDALDKFEEAINVEEAKNPQLVQGINREVNEMMMRWRERATQQHSKNLWEQFKALIGLDQK